MAGEGFVRRPKNVAFDKIREPDPTENLPQIGVVTSNNYG